MYILNRQHLHDFATTHHLLGLSDTAIKAIVEGYNHYSVTKGERFLAFQQRINAEMLQHRVITDNRYTAWFKRGGQTTRQMQAFIVQFSVFSNQFLIAQLQKVIHADSLESMRASKEILANEIGVVFAKPNASDHDGHELVSAEGSVEGGVFYFRAGHFEWLLTIAKQLTLNFNDIGKRMHGTPSTLFFCDALIRLYGSSDYRISQAASFAVEHWAAAGFWKELIAGIEKYNRRLSKDLHTAFFRWHDRIEDQHALHTQEELESLYFQHEIDEDHFLHYGNEMLDGVSAFWDGLNQQRKQLTPH